MKNPLPILLLTAVASLAMLILAGCSKRIDSRLVGQYEDQANTGGRFFLDDDQCSVSGPQKPGGKSSRILNGTCEQIGEGSIKMTMSQGFDSDFGYPDFRGESTILKVEGTTLVTQNGTRFIWKFK